MSTQTNPTPPLPPPPPPGPSEPEEPPQWWWNGPLSYETLDDDGAVIEKELPDGVGLIETMSARGDIKVEFDRDKKAEVDYAKERFDDAKRRGYAIFRVDKEGKRSERIFDFDPTSRRFILVPQLAGGR